MVGDCTPIIPPNTEGLGPTAETTEQRQSGSGRTVGKSELIQPRTGTMLVFPSWLSHGVRPYRGNATRISIAINMSV